MYLWQTGITYWGFFFLVVVLVLGCRRFSRSSIAGKKNGEQLLKRSTFAFVSKGFFFFFSPRFFAESSFLNEFSIISSRHIPGPCLPGLWVVFKSRDSFKASFISILCTLFRTFAPVMLNFSVKTQVRHPRAPGLGLEPVQLATCPLEGADPTVYRRTRKRQPTHFWSSQALIHYVSLKSSSVKSPVSWRFCFDSRIGCEPLVRIRGKTYP